MSAGVEVRLALRRLAGSPGYAAGVYLTLALGLALSVGMYTVPVLYAAGICGALLAALLASTPPAWRAAHIQPMVVLREE